MLVGGTDGEEEGTEVGMVEGLPLGVLVGVVVGTADGGVVASDGWLLGLKEGATVGGEVQLTLREEGAGNRPCGCS